MYLKSDFVGVPFLVEAVGRDAILAAANNRGQRGFNLIAQYGDTTTTPPLSLATMLQTYTFPTLAAVDGFLNHMGPRGSEFLIALAANTGGVPDQPSITEVDNVYTATGTWPGGTVITFTCTVTDPDGQSDTHVYPITLPPGQHSGATVAGVCAASLDPQTHIRAVAAGNVLTLSPADPDYSLVSSVSVS
jgi:hypothetical protein